MKNFELKDIERVVETLTSNGQKTTNLNIKQALRREHFWATQDKVSSMMMANHPDFGLDYTENGVHRTYFKEQTMQSGGGLGLGSIAITQPSNAGSQFIYIKRDGKNVLTTSTPVAGDWRVVANIDSMLNDTRTSYFESKYTRDEVRQATASHEGVHFHHTRTYKVK